jgi:hypothetical protein
MKKLFLISILFCCVINAYCQTNLNGLWGWVNETSGFSLKLIQINDVITGYHCATSNNGMFIDSGLDRISVRGTVQGDSAIVTFISGYCGEQGTAVIKRIDATHIRWRIIKEPEGDSYIPENVVMDLDSSHKASSFTKIPTKINTNTEVQKKAVPTLIGVWGVSKGENANFAIEKDSIYYPDAAESLKYSVISDSIFFNGGAYKYILRNDSLILIDKFETSKFVSLEGRSAKDEVPTLEGSFTMQPGFYNITSCITKYENFVSLYIAFFPYSTMQVGVNYLVANISANCRPLVKQYYKHDGDKSWDITIDPNGDIYFKIKCCSSLSGGVGFNYISYPL